MHRLRPMMLFRSSAKRALLYASFVAFAAKALIPLGYMPAAVADGSPVRLCDAWGFALDRHASDAGSAAAMVHMDGAMHPGHGVPAGGDGKEPHRDAHWEHCPLGALAGAAAVPAADLLVVLTPQPSHVRPFADEPRRDAVPTLGFRSRAPPLPISII